MPVASVGGNSVGQSVAINFLIASELGLMGANTFEAAQILAIQEHVKEMRTKFMELVPWGQEPNPEKLNEWFEGGATDVTGAADRAGYATRYAKWWVGRIEAVLGNNGYAVGNQISLADVILYVVFGDYLRPEEAKEDFPQYKREPFCSKAKTDALVASHPKLSASLRAVANNANIQKWLETRGVQGF
jgi:glutathione S-transferase